jgi:nicotinamidase-related amidase
MCMPDPAATTALLVMDVQPGIIDRVADPSDYLNRVQSAVDVAHARRFPVIYVVVGFRPGAPEASERFKSLAPKLIDPGPVLTPGADDLVVVKRRVSAFAGSDLEVLLRTLHIRHLVLTGIATSGVVLSTLREASDKDFQITVIADLCADADEEVHRVLVTKVFPRQARVVTLDEWCSASVD